jgi:hypothetical protein
LPHSVQLKLGLARAKGLQSRFHLGEYNILKRNRTSVGGVF